MIEIKKDTLYSQKDLEKVLNINNNHASRIMQSVPRYKLKRPYLAYGKDILEYLQKNLE